MEHPTFAFTGLPVVVPADFLGMNMVRYPSSGASPAGVLNWKMLRLCQMSEARWSTIETSAGVYSASALSTLDSIITFQRQNGATVYFGIYGTPVFYASAAANPSFGDNVTVGPWGASGEAANPTSLTAVTNFVTMLVNRYNKAGGAWFDANGATLGKGIQAWETWNEPAMGAGGNGNAVGSGSTGAGFFWGTAAQLVDLAQTQYAAVKAADASITVTSPGLTSLAAADLFLTTTGALTKTGLQSCDALALHPYGMTPVGVSYRTWQQDAFLGTLGAQTIKDRLRAYSLPVWFSEWGVDAAGSGSTVTAWYAAAASVRYTWLARILMYFAGSGIRCVCPWHWGETSPTQGNSGWWQGDTDGVVAAYNDFATKVSGKTIVSGTYQYQGPVTLNFSNGSSWTV